MSHYISQAGVTPFRVHTFVQQQRDQRNSSVVRERVPVSYQDFFKDVVTRGPGH